jgi:hypothetical protein
MTNTNLLKEAIADAKAVKETAIANAKLALEEAFTPHLKSMLSAKLQEMDEEDVKEEEIQEMDDVSWNEKNNPTRSPFVTLKDPKKVGQTTSNYAINEEEEEMDEEINLDELLAELELGEDARTDAEEEGYLDGEEDEKEDMEGEMDDEEIDLEDMSEDDLKGFIESVIKDMVASGEIEPGDDFEGESEEEGEEAENEENVEIEIAEGEEQAEKDTEKMRFKEEEELDEYGSSTMREPSDAAAAGLENIISGLKKLIAKGGPLAAKAKAALADWGSAAGAAMRAEGESTELDEIEELKKELNEVNLLNAKLLYTNKIFRAKNLTESKKVTVLKAFDNAKDVKQAKTIYETLNAGLMDKNVNESVKRGLASQATGLEPKATVQPIIESNDVYNRMRKLAGLL